MSTADKPKCLTCGKSAKCRRKRIPQHTFCGTPCALAFIEGGTKRPWEEQDSVEARDLVLITPDDRRIAVPAHVVAMSDTLMNMSQDAPTDAEVQLHTNHMDIVALTKFVSFPQPVEDQTTNQLNKTGYFAGSTQRQLHDLLHVSEYFIANTIVIAVLEEIAARIVQIAIDAKTRTPHWYVKGYVANWQAAYDEVESWLTPIQLSEIRKWIAPEANRQFNRDRTQGDYHHRPTVMIYSYLIRKFNLRVYVSQAPEFTFLIFKFAARTRMMDVMKKTQPEPGGQFTLVKEYALAGAMQWQDVFQFLTNVQQQNDTGLWYTIFSLSSDVHVVEIAENVLNMRIADLLRRDQMDAITVFLYTALERGRTDIFLPIFQKTVQQHAFNLPALREMIKNAIGATFSINIVSKKDAFTAIHLIALEIAKLAAALAEKV